MILQPAKTRGCRPGRDIRALLKRERLARGMSRDEAARQIGMHPNAFIQMESGSGRGSHNLDTVRRWAALFGYDIGVTITKRKA